MSVSGGLAFTTVSLGTYHSCGVTAGGAAYCWGYNPYGQLGDGTPPTDRHSPAAVSGGLTFATLDAGLFHTCGVTTGDVAYCWGYNNLGRLGDGTTTDRHIPVAVSGGLAFTTVSAGSFHSCAVTSGHAAYCWGNNGVGQLGDGTTTQRLSPVAVLGGHNFASLSAGSPQGSAHTCGVTNDDAAYCWGLNVQGQLGDGTTTQRVTPVRVVQ